MKTKRGLTRRIFLRLACLGPIGLAAPRRGAAPGREASQDPLALRLARLIKARESAERVGRAYLAGTPREADPRVLLEAIAPGPPEARARLLSEDPARLKAWIRGRVRADFDQGLTVCVDGWVLSATEARLCALAALLWRA